MSDKTWMSPEELEKCSRAYDVESEEFCSPIPTQNISNGEYQPKPQSEKQKEVEARIKEYADGAAKKLGVSRRDFLVSSGGMAASFMAMNDVYGKFFDVGKEELFEPAAHDRHGLPSDTFVVDDQLHFVRGNTRTTLGAPALRAIAQGGQTREGNFFSDAFGFPTNPFNPDGFRDEANNEPYYPWNKRLAAEYLANPNKYVNEVNAFTAPYSGVQNLDAKGAGDAFHFLRFIKDVYLDSQVTVGLISNVTAFVDVQPGTNLPVTNVEEARLARSSRPPRPPPPGTSSTTISGSLAHALPRPALRRQGQSAVHPGADRQARAGLVEGVQHLELRQGGGRAVHRARQEQRSARHPPERLMRQWRHDDEEVAYPTFELIQKNYDRLKGKKPGFNNICVHKGLAPGPPDPSTATRTTCPAAAATGRSSTSSPITPASSRTSSTTSPGRR